MSRPKHQDAAVEKEISFLEGLRWTVVFSEREHQFHLYCQQSRGKGKEKPCLIVGEYDGGRDAFNQIRQILARHRELHPDALP